MANHEDFGDLREDLQRLSRRRMLGLFAALPLAGCLTANDEGDLTDAALRGVQVTDDSGQVTFTSIFPACYSGRWPHIHFEVYASVDEATTGSAKVAVSQLAMPKATCDLVYATTGYSASVSNLAQISLATDNVFSDGATLQIPTISGSVSAGYAASLTAAIDV